MIIQKILLIDDMRTVDEVHHFPSSGGGAEYKIVVARTYQAGIEYLKGDTWDILYLDHDLGCFENGKELNGMGILTFIEEKLNVKPGRIELVTSNASRRNLMQLVIDRMYGKER